MPIRPENLHRYPPDWPKIRARILRRAGNCCERCKVANGQIGGRLRDGTFCPAVPEERLGRLRWPDLGSRSWCVPPGGQLQWEKLRIIRIVLTIAHLDHVIENCSDDNLQSLCQRCHLLHDAQHHAETRYRTRREGLAVSDLFEVSEAGNPGGRTLQVAFSTPIYSFDEFKDEVIEAIREGVER